jgi:hypothetical protein
MLEVLYYNSRQTGFMVASKEWLFPFHLQENKQDYTQGLEGSVSDQYWGAS